MKKILKTEKTGKDLYFVGSKPYVQMIQNSFGNKLSSVSTNLERTKTSERGRNEVEIDGGDAETDHVHHINRIKSTSSEGCGKILSADNSQQQNVISDIEFTGEIGETDIETNINETEDKNDNNHDKDKDSDSEDSNNYSNRGYEIPSIGPRSEELVALTALRRKEEQLLTQQTGEDYIEQSSFIECQGK